MHSSTHKPSFIDLKMKRCFTVPFYELAFQNLILSRQDIQNREPTHKLVRVGSENLVEPVEKSNLVKLDQNQVDS